MFENLWISGNLIPRMGQFLLIGNLASNKEKQMALIGNYCEAKDIKVTIKIKCNDKLQNFSFRLGKSGQRYFLLMRKG